EENKMKKRIALITSIVMIFTLCLGLAGCSKKPNDSAEYAIILKNLSNDFWATMKKGIETEAEKLGIKVDIYAAQSEDDTEGQLKILENCLNKNYKAIGVAPLSPVNLISGVVKANQKGIYVMNIDEKIDLSTLKAQGGSVIAFATTDNVKVGEKGASYIVDRLTDGGKVAIIEGKAGNASGEARKEGATNIFKANSKFQLVASQPADWDRQKALDVATTYIQKYPDLKAIYCCNDTMALGAVQAVKNANMIGKIVVVGTDGAAEALTSIKAGELDATVAQNSAEIGATSLRAMVDAVKNQIKIDANTEPKTIPVDSYIVNKDSK
ncbi:MAG: D-allose transporter substrate-binding protein, partial [Oscillospiraceae bacterium]